MDCRVNIAELNNRKNTIRNNDIQEEDNVEKKEDRRRKNCKIMLTKIINYYNYFNTK